MYRSHPCSIVSIDLQCTEPSRCRILASVRSGSSSKSLGLTQWRPGQLHRVTNTDVRLKPGDLPVRPSEWFPGPYLGQEATILNQERLSNFVIISFLDPRSPETQNGYGNYTSPRAVDLFTRIQQVSDTGNMGAVIRHHNVHPFNTTVGESFQNVRIRMIALMITVGWITQLKPH
jgi:hypothetical protein